MRRFRDDRPVDVCFARGTFNSHPYVMTAMDEFLSRLASPNFNSIYNGLDETWNTRAEGLNVRLTAADLPVRVSNISSIWMVAIYRTFALQLDASILPARRRPGLELGRQRPSDFQLELHRR